MLLFGVLPMAGIPSDWLDSLWVNVYQLPAAALLLFLSFPAMWVLIWALDRWLSNFEHFTKYVATGAAVLQVASLWFLATIASQAITQAVEAMHINADTIPQRLGAGFFLLLGVSVLFLIDCGLQLVKPRRKQFVPVQFPEKELETTSQ